VSRLRVLLAAFSAAKGDVEANLEGHARILEQARSQRCDLVVFPECSLTGSVDPTVHPERALAVDAEAVGRLVAETDRSGVAAVFGISERAADGFYLTQLYTHDGRLSGWYRKRHLGEDERGYHTGTADGVFRFGAARFGIVICAEGGVDFPWASAASGGAQVVCFCAAPGLYGRRTDQESWRRGHDWWVGEGLGNAVRAARRHGLWVALATQAGVTEDEDIPGLAALVTPDGKVAARLPDWRPGTLVVDIPVDVAVHPVRQAARALVVDETGRTLLVRFVNRESGTAWWTTPGGGLDEGEDHLAAVRRELREELGHDGLALGPWIGRRTHTFRGIWDWMTQHERWILARTQAFTPDPERVASLRAEHVDAMRWWSAEELRAAGVVVTPRDLPRLLDDVNAGRLPDPTTDLGV
jgi:predicted amidohydrolase/predicted NUDIX family NTP pyrophosphohydrolase